MYAKRGTLGVWEAEMCNVAFIVLRLSFVAYVYPPHAEGIRCCLVSHRHEGNKLDDELIV